MQKCCSKIYFTVFKQVLCTLISFKLKFDILKKLNYYVISKKRYSKIKSGTPKNLYSRPGAFRGPRSLLAPPLHTDLYREDAGDWQPQKPEEVEVSISCQPPLHGPP